MLVGGGAFLFGMARRNKFWLRITLCLAGFSGICCLMPFLNISSGWLPFVTAFACNFGLYLICYKINWFQALFFASMAWGLQNAVFQFLMLVQDDSGLLYDLPAVREVLYYVILAALSAAVYFLWIRRLHIEVLFSVKNISIAVICVAVLLIVCVVNMNLQGKDTYARILIILLVFVLQVFAFSIVMRRQKDIETEEIKKLLRREEELHKLSKESMEAINMKYHDLKHFVLSVKNLQPGQKADISDMEKLIEDYGAFIKTGNADLDIVLAEKNLLWNKKGVKLNCVIDGGRLSFMAPADIYSLFGNAIDNAAEYLERVADEEKRVIYVTVKLNGGIVGVRVENYCAESPVFSDGLPVTTKSCKSEHGFGMKSMRYIVDKYGGNFVAEYKDCMFSVNIIFPRSPRIAEADEVAA